MVICLPFWSESMTDKFWSRDRKISKNFFWKTKEMLANCEQKVCKLSGAKFVMFCKQFANISWVCSNKILRTIFFYRCGGICSVKLSEHRGKQLTLLNWSRFTFGKFDIFMLTFFNYWSGHFVVIQLIKLKVLEIR